MPLGRLVERAYGGNKGVWFRKKPQRAGKAGDDGIDDEHTAATIDEDHETEHQRGEAGEKGERKRRISVDQNGPDSSKGQNNDDSSDDDDSEEEEQIETDSGWFGGLLSASKPAKRSYGNQKRKRAVVAPLPTIAEPSKKRTRGGGASVAAAVPKADQNTLFLPSPLVETPAYKSMVCSALNSVSKFTPKLPLPSRQQETPAGAAGGGAAPVVSGTDDSSRSSGDDKQAPAVKSNKRVAVKKHPKSSRNPNLSGTAFDPIQDDPVSQPSSKTSVDAARAFFERLDSTQTLTLDTSQSPGKPAVRTRYMVSTDNQELQDEYDNYVEASRGNGVVPLSLQDYAENRSAYFRTKDMYDGFLDG